MHPSLTRDRKTQERRDIIRVPSVQFGILVAQYIEARIIVLRKPALGCRDAGVNFDRRMRHLGGRDPLQCSHFTDDATSLSRD